MKFSDYVNFREADENDIATEVEPIVVNPAEESEKIQPKISKKFCEPLNQIFSNAKQVLKTSRNKNLSDKQIFDAAREELFNGYELINKYLNMYVRKYFRNLEEKGLDYDDIISDVIVILLSQSEKDKSKFKIDYEKRDFSDVQQACKIINTVAKNQVFAKLKRKKKETVTAKGSELEQLPEKGRQIGGIEVGKGNIAGDIEKSVDTEKDEDENQGINTDTAEMMQKIENIINDKLSGQQKNVAIAVFMNKLNKRDVAETLEISEQAVGQLWKKAKIKILKALKFSDEKIDQMVNRRSTFIVDSPVTAAVMNALKSPDEFETRLRRKTTFSRPADRGDESEPSSAFTGTVRSSLLKTPGETKAIRRYRKGFEGPAGKPEPSRISQDKLFSFGKKGIRLGGVEETPTELRKKVLQQWIDMMPKGDDFYPDLIDKVRKSLREKLNQKIVREEGESEKDFQEKLRLRAEDIDEHKERLKELIKLNTGYDLIPRFEKWMRLKRTIDEKLPDAPQQKLEPKIEDFNKYVDPQHNYEDYVDALSSFYGLKRRPEEKETSVTSGPQGKEIDVDYYLGGSYYKPAHVGIDKIQDIAKDLVAKSREAKKDDPDLNIASHALAAAFRVEKQGRGYFSGLRDAVSKLVSFAVPEPNFSPNQASSQDMYQAGAEKFVQDNLPEIMQQIQIEHPNMSSSFYHDAAGSELLRHAIEFEKQHPHLRGVPISTTGLRFRGKGSTFSFANAVSKYFNEKIRPTMTTIVNQPPRWMEPSMAALPTSVSVEKGRGFDLQQIATRLLADNGDVELAKSVAENMEQKTIEGYRTVKKKDKDGKVVEIQVPITKFKGLSQMVSALGKLYEKLTDAELAKFKKLPNVAEKLRFLKAKKLERYRIMNPKFPN